MLRHQALFMDCTTECSSPVSPLCLPGSLLDRALDWDPVELGSATDLVHDFRQGTSPFVPLSPLPLFVCLVCREKLFGKGMSPSVGASALHTAFGSTANTCSTEITSRVAGEVWLR